MLVYQRVYHDSITEFDHRYCISCLMRFSHSLVVKHGKANVMNQPQNQVVVILQVEIVTCPHSSW